MGERKEHTPIKKTKTKANNNNKTNKKKMVMVKKTEEQPGNCLQSACCKWWQVYSAGIGRPKSERHKTGECINNISLQKSVKCQWLLRDQVTLVLLPLRKK